MCLCRLGYDEKLAQKAIQTRGTNADDNELLRVLISIVDSQKAMEYVKRNKPTGQYKPGQYFKLISSLLFFVMKIEQTKILRPSPLETYLVADRWIPYGLSK